MGKRLKRWKRALISKEGGFTLVQSVLSSIFIYYLPIFQVLVRVANKIEKMSTDFCGRDLTKGKWII